MQNFRKILVGVDLSHADRLAASELNAPTQEAVKRAVWLAAHSSAELTFYAALDISAHTVEVLEELKRSTRTVKDEAIIVLNELVDLAKKEDVEASAKLEIASPWEGIIKQVVHENHDLVVVGRRSDGCRRRESEIHEFDNPVRGQHDVCGLDISVNHADRMGVPQRSGNLTEHLAELSFGEED